MTVPGTDEKGRQRRPNWVEIWTFVTLVATLIAVVWYACEAHRANDLTRLSVETNTRPYIKIDILPDTFAVKKIPDAGGGERMSVQLTIENTGKLPAPASVQSGLDWQSNGHRRASDNKAPQTTALIGRRYLFPDQDSGRFTAMTNELNVGELAELRADGFKQFYVVVSVWYGPISDITKYETRVCNVYPITGPLETLRLGSGEPCKDEGSNRAQ